MFYSNNRNSLSSARLSVTAAFLFASFFDDASSHVLPRQTNTVELREFEVELWPLQPTAAPQLASDDTLLRRQFNTVCGFIGGDSALPATCSAGSHCAADSEHGVIGCCPDVGPCTQGIFTGCVDRNSDPQTELNPYVFTCSGSDVCYQNQFDGGFFQYGCGSASSLANTVATALTGAESLTFARVSAKLTESAASLTEPTTIGTQTRDRASATSTGETSARESSEERLSTETKPSPTTTGSNVIKATSETTTSRSTTAESETTTSTEAPSSTETKAMESDTEAAAAPDNDGGNSTNVGAIVGGAVGGVAAVALILTAAIWFWRRKNRRNSREGPGVNPSSDYITPMTDNREDTRFTQLPTTWEEPEPELQPPPRSSARPAPYGAPGATGDFYRNDSNSSGENGAITLGGGGTYEQDRQPLTGELTDFSRGFNTAIDGVQGHEGEHAPNSQGMHQDGRRPGGGGGALWHQNLRQSRNMMWM